jgi:hypothetical protein
VLSRKYYVAIAAVLKDRKESTRLPLYKEAIRDVAHDLAGQFAFDNPNFDRERFLKAAGAA